MTAEQERYGRTSSASTINPNEISELTQIHDLHMPVPDPLTSPTKVTMSSHRMLLRVVMLAFILFLGVGLLMLPSSEWVQRTDWVAYKRKLTSFGKSNNGFGVDMHQLNMTVNSILRHSNSSNIGKSHKPIPDVIDLGLDETSLPKGKKSAALKELEESYWSAERQLQSGLVPSVLHFPWCGKRWFHFKHYLAIMSAIRATGPDMVIIHYEHEPTQDILYYHQWMDDLKHDYPFLSLVHMKPEELPLCGTMVLDRLQVIFNYLKEYGGIFIGDETWLINYPPERRKADFEYALNHDATQGYIMLRGGVLKNQTYMDFMENNTGLNVSHRTCATLRQFYEGNYGTHCMIMPQGGRYDYFNPMHIWELKDPFGRLVRKIFYGTEDILKPEPTFDELVPNIGHMIWIGGGNVDFVFYLSILSLLYVVGVDNVYIHGDKEPKGIYWEKIKNDQPRVKFITRPEPLKIYQGDIEPFYRALMSDLIRVDIMIKYGGIYTDTDAIWVKPLSQRDRGYEAVASFDWIDWSWPYPDSVNFGISYGKRNAPFWRIFRESMRILHNDIHGFTGVMNPYKLMEKYPHLLRIDPHLSVICYNLKCHPTWVENYHDEENNHVTKNTIPNFSEDVNAFHWTFPNPPELKSEEALRNATGDGIFVKIGRHVLKKAGLW